VYYFRLDIKIFATFIVQPVFIVVILDHRGLQMVAAGVGIQGF
jgi:hypothetical protein